MGIENEEVLIMPDDFCLQPESHVSAKVELGKSASSEIEMPSLEMEFPEPKLKSSPVKIENVEHSRRGATSGLF